METILINTAKPYNVYMGQGLLSQAGNLALKVHKPCSIAIVGEAHILKLYGPTVSNSFLSSGFHVEEITIGGGEENKSIHTVETILDQLTTMDFTRQDMVVALGGGITGDLTGFAASIYLRGIPFIQIPTSYLAAVDASVGGKTGVNLKAGKNLAGCFWQPETVIYDTDTLKTLPSSCLQDGLAEVVKSAVISDSSLFGDIRYILKNQSSNLETKDLLDMAKRSVQIKASMVVGDERDKGKRQLLNFGHTIGHAIEKASNFQISHGQAVAMGMIYVSKAALHLGLSQEDYYTPLVEVLTLLGFKLSCPFKPDQLMETLLHDKKRQGKFITLVIPNTIGNCQLKEVAIRDLDHFLSKGDTYEY